MDFAAHVVFVSVFADRAFYGVSSSGFYRFYRFYQDGRYRCYRFDNGSTGERGGGVEAEEWKRKSKKSVGDHREGQDNGRGGKDEDGQAEGQGW